MNTATAPQPNIHAAELLVCGCRVDVHTGAVFSTCPRHTCSAVVRFKELPEHALEVMPITKNAEGLRALCPCCSSPRIVARTDYLECKDCGAQFQPSEIIGYGLCDDGGPRRCDCGVVHDGLADTCFRCTQQEVAQ